MIGLAERLLAGGVLLCLAFAGGYRLGVTL